MGASETASTPIFNEETNYYHPRVPARILTHVYGDQQLPPAVVQQVYTLKNQDI